MSPRHAQILGRRFGANLVSRKTGLSLLHLAAGGFDAKAIVQELLDGGADPSAGTLAAVLLGGTRFRKGASPLAIAKGLGRNETVAVLEAANEPRPTRSRKPKAARSLRPRGA
jgi:ankyrin repeat protein